jgi:hypothetical protein
MNQKAIAVAWCLLWAALHQPALLLMPLSLFRFLACMASIAFVFFLTKQKLEVSVSAYLISFGISYCLYYITASFSAVFFMFLFRDNHILGTPLDFNHPIFLVSYTFGLVMQLVLASFLFRIRRFRKGFPFIFNKYAIIFALIFTGIILALVSRGHIIAASDENIYAARYIYVAGVLVAGIGIYILIRTLITNYQRKRAQQNTESHFEKLYHEMREKYEQAIEMYKVNQSIIHNFIERIESMENAVKKGNDALKMRIKS